MEQAHRFYGISSMDRRTSDWDLNGWKWDGDLFIATPLDPNFRSQQFIKVPMAPMNSSNSSSSCSDDLVVDKGKRELDRKRRVIVLDDDNLEDEAGTLTLKLGGCPRSEREIGVGHMEGTSGKKTKLAGGSSNRAVCQVEDCGADLSNAKDYHRRHKVCEMHSKATKALVGNAMQRFCQQCSRFHVLQEFDEGKRSCRRRLAGHNKRRRKTQPDTAVVSGQSIDDEQASNYILINLLKILSGMNANHRADQTTDQDLVSHLLRSLAKQSGRHEGKDVSQLLKESQKLLNVGTSNGNSETTSAFLSNSPHVPPRPPDQHLRIPASEIPLKGFCSVDNRDAVVQLTSSVKPTMAFSKESPPAQSEVSDCGAGRAKLNNFDLNDAYIDSDDGVEDLERSPAMRNFGTPSWTPQHSQLSSPPHISGNSDSASAQSPSSSSGEAQSRTDRIVFKLFGKEPNDFPIALRGQILDWLAHSPTDIESYIRPGCIILTIYLRLSESIWEEFCSDLGSSVCRLFDMPSDTFWRTGWVYTRVQHQIAFIYDGEVVVNTSLPLSYGNCSRIFSVTPIAVSISEEVQFQVRGLNLARPTSRLLCALEGKYLVHEDCQELVQDGDCLEENNEVECVSLSCSMPSVTGRGFIEVEDNGFGSSFFPFIVAEKDVCSEIRMLEAVLEFLDADEDSKRGGETEARHQAMDFIHEIGWLLHRSQLKARLADQNLSTDVFSFKRFKWLMEYSMDHDWCAVVKKLLDILLEGTVGTGDHPSLYAALSEMGLLHRAVRRNYRPLVELLLRYVPVTKSEYGSNATSTPNKGHENFLFRPDAAGPAGLTPLHLAAGRDGSEDVLDALTNDPGKVGIEAWKSARDSTGSTPEDYARLRGQFAYIHLVQKKMNSRRHLTGSVVLDIPDAPSDNLFDSKRISAASFQIARSGSSSMRPCKLCDQKLMYGNRGRSLVYKPAMFSIVAIAAVCVCVALLFKSLPEVVCVFQPFRWESLEYGSS